MNQFESVKHIHSSKRTVYKGTVVKEDNIKEHVVVIKGEVEDSFENIQFVYIFSKENNTVELYLLKEKLENLKLASFRDEDIFKYLEKHLKVLLKKLIDTIEEYQDVVDDKILFELVKIKYEETFTN